MTKPRILISGAGIAGPALALCLADRGFETTIVERAPALRPGGQAVDFRGPVHRAVLERLGLWDAIVARRTRAVPLALLDRAGRPRATLPAVLMSGDVEILRGDLAQLLYERTRETTDYRFDDRITRIVQGPGGDGVEVELLRGGTARFDLVVGADGLHSGVRTLAFAPRTTLVLHHGYRIATFELPLAGPGGVPDRGAWVYSAPGRGVCVVPSFATTARALLIHAAPPLGAERHDVAHQRRAIRAAFAGLGWQVPRVLDALDRATDLYVDSIATVHVDRYATGRVVLLGDAAYGGTLGGQGTPLAVIGAYVLATELAAGGARDPAAALARYEATMRPYATACQKGATRAGGFFAPRTAAGVWLRNAVYGLLTSRGLRGVFERMVKAAATDVRLPGIAV